MVNLVRSKAKQQAGCSLAARFGAALVHGTPCSFADSGAAATCG
jgi:hypothetical protein